MIVARSSPTLAALRIFIVLAGAAMLAGWAPASAKAEAGPFGRFAGVWTGGGQVVGARGDRERIRCRANYAEFRHGEAMTQTIVCASASYRMDIQSHVEASGGMVRGAWSETTRNVTGSLTGRIADGRFVGAVNGPNFAAQVSLSSNGKRQEVNIRPSAGDIAEVTIELERKS